MGKKFINSETIQEEVLRKINSLRSRKTESKTVNLVIKLSNTFNNTTVDERYQQNNMRSKIPITIWWNHSKEISNIKEHPKTPFRLAKLDVLFSKGNSNRYGARIEDKNHSVIDDAQNGCATANKSLYDHHRGVINNDARINCENMRREYHNEENNVYVNNEQEKTNSVLQDNLSYNHHDVNLPPQVNTTAPPNLQLQIFLF